MTQHALKTETRSLYERIESLDARLAENARHFTINASKFAVFLEKLPRKPEQELLSPDCHLFDADDVERTLNYFFALEAVNFGGPYSKLLRAEGFQEPECGLYETVALRLKRYFEDERNLPAHQMAQISPEDIRLILKFDPAKPVSAKISSMFAESLNEMGRYCAREFGGSFCAFLDAADGSVENFVERLWHYLPKFRDAHDYTFNSNETFEIPVLKRAQHLAASLSLALPRCGQRAPFRDADKITAFPDNKISHVMMVEGILIPSNQLKAKIEAGERFAIGAPEELENRILGRYIIRLMARQAGTTQVALDHQVWEHSHGNSVLHPEIQYSDVPHLMTIEPSFNY